jgi:hypothetical protein
MSPYLEQYLIKNGVEDYSVLDKFQMFTDTINGVEVGTLLVKDNEIHYIANPDRKGVPVKMMRKYLGPLMEKYGFIQTKVIRGHDGPKKFVEKFGFTKIGQDALFEYFALGELP